MPTEPKWTKGPWRLAPYDSRLIWDARGLCVADLTSPDRLGYSAEADARLIAAAPDLYEALEAFLQLDDANHQAAIDKARAALARARGEE